MAESSGGGIGSLLSPVGLGLGIIGSIGKLFGNAKANKELKVLQASDPNYNTSAAGIANHNLASGRLGLAQTLLNARMPGAQSVERNIYGSQANALGNINRNATDSSTALALGSAVQGQTNNAFENLGLQENNDYQRRYQNLTGAEEGMMNENNRGFEDDVRRFSDKAQIQGAINQNRQNSWGSISNGGFALANFGMNGGFGGGGNRPITGMGTDGFNSAGYATGIH